MQLHVQGLTKHYPGVAALDGIDLDIESGEVFAILGPNGAGKTTTVEILEGYRADFDRDLDSILMDMRAYEEFEPFGTDTDQNGRELAAGRARVVDRLRPSERTVYELLVGAEHPRHRRVEQERIPLSRALADVKKLLRGRH